MADFTTPVESGKVVSGETVGSGGMQIVSSGGKAVDGWVTAGGEQTLLAGAEANGMTLSGNGKEYGLQNVLANATASNTVVQSGGQLNVREQGTAIDVILEAGGGVATETTVTKVTGSDTVTGRIFSVENGSAVNFVVGGGVAFAVHDNNKAVNTLVREEGQLTVEYGGSVSSTQVVGVSTTLVLEGRSYQTVVIAGGREEVRGDATAEQTSIESGGSQTVFTDGIANSTVIKADGTQYVSGGETYRTVISSGGRQIVTSRGLDSGAVILAGGSQVISSGRAVAEDTQVGGIQEVSNNGSARKATIVDGGLQIVGSRGLSRNTTVQAGGRVVVSKGGLLTDIVISSGGQLEVRDSNVEIGGKVQIDGGKVITGEKVDVASQPGTEFILNGNADLSEAQFTVDSGTVDVYSVGNFWGNLTLGTDGKLNIHLPAADGLSLTVSNLLIGDGAVYLRNDNWEDKTYQFMSANDLSGQYFHIEDFTRLIEVNNGFAVRVGLKTYKLDQVEGLLSLTVASIDQTDTLVIETAETVAVSTKLNVLVTETGSLTVADGTALTLTDSTHSTVTLSGNVTVTGQVTADAAAIQFGSDQISASLIFDIVDQPVTVSAVAAVAGDGVNLAGIAGRDDVDIGSVQYEGLGEQVTVRVVGSGPDAINAWGIRAADDLAFVVRQAASAALAGNVLVDAGAMGNAYGLSAGGTLAAEIPKSGLEVEAVAARITGKVIANGGGRAIAVSAADGLMLTIDGALFAGYAAAGVDHILALLNVADTSSLEALHALVKNSSEAYAIRSGWFNGEWVANPSSNDDVTVSTGALVFGSIDLGGGRNTLIGGEAKIYGHIYLGTGVAELSGTTYSGSFYGGGNRMRGEAAVNVTLSNVVGYNFFGGGYKAGVDSVVVNLNGARINYFYGGGLQGAVDKTVNVTVNDGSYWKFYGGGADGAVNGDITIEMNGGSVTNVLYGGGIGNVGGNIALTINQGMDFSAKPNIYGGILAGYTGALNSAKADGTVENASGAGGTVTGNITLTVNGATLTGLVHGGNYNEGTGSQKVISGVDGKVTVELVDATQLVSDSGWLFGGSYVNAAQAEDVIHNGVEINVSGASDLGFLLGGSRAGHGGSASVQGGTSINISGGTFNKDIYGGGFAGAGSTSTVTGGASIRIDTANAAVTINGSIFLGGYANGAGAVATVDSGRITFTGSGERLQFDGYVNGSGKAIGSGAIGGLLDEEQSTLAFVDYTGDFNATVVDVYKLTIAGNSSVNLTRELPASGSFTAYEFDLSSRDYASAGTAMLTVKNGMEFSIADNAYRNITITSAALDGQKSGSFLLIDSTAELLASLTGKLFNVTFDSLSKSVAVNSSSTVAIGSYEWGLELKDGKLSLFWKEPEVPGNSLLGDWSASMQLADNGSFGADLSMAAADGLQLYDAADRSLVSKNGYLA